MGECEELTEPTATDDYSFSLPAFHIPPTRSFHFRNLFRTPSNLNNFVKGVKWSPDGSCFLTNSDDNTFRAFSFGCNLEESVCHFSDADSYGPYLVLSEGESVYDFCWYPFMTASDQVTCVFASTTRDHPIHLWDASSGQLRSTYRAYDSMDEIAAAFSIAFNPSGTKIYAGYNKSFRVFDIHRPGRDFGQYSTVKDKEGQRGIISSISFSPTHTGMVAMGSYDRTAAIYEEGTMELMYLLHGHEGGITHTQFSSDGNYLYTGGRMDPYIFCWDVRNTVDIVYKLYRSAESTNQRITFDIEPQGRYLSTGGQDGLVHVYDLQTGCWVSSFKAASDTVNGISFHPSLPFACSSSGHRRFAFPDTSEDHTTDLDLGEDENCVSVWSFSSGDLKLMDNPLPFPISTEN